MGRAAAAAAGVARREMQHQLDDEWTCTSLLTLRRFQPRNFDKASCGFNAGAQANLIEYRRRPLYHVTL